jgi:hypothetical protein
MGALRESKGNSTKTLVIVDKLLALPGWDLHSLAAHDADSTLFQAFKDECARVWRRHYADRDGVEVAQLRTKAVAYPGVKAKKNNGRAGSVVARREFQQHTFRLTKTYPAGTSTADFEEAKLSASTSYREISKLIGTKPVAGVVMEALCDGGWVDMGRRDKSTEPSARKKRAQDVGDGLGRGLLG